MLREFSREEAVTAFDPKTDFLGGALWNTFNPILGSETAGQKFITFGENHAAADAAQL